MEQKLQELFIECVNELKNIGIYILNEKYIVFHIAIIMAKSLKNMLI